MTGKNDPDGGRQAIVPDAPTGAAKPFIHASSRPRTGREVVFCIDREEATHQHSNTLGKALDPLIKDLEQNGVGVKTVKFTGLAHLLHQLEEQAGDNMPRQVIVLTAGHLANGELGMHAGYLKAHPRTAMDFMIFGEADNPKDDFRAAPAQLLRENTSGDQKPLIARARADAVDIRAGLKDMIARREGQHNVWIQHDNASTPRRGSHLENTP